MRTTRGRRGTRVLHGLATAGAVLGIVAASMIGLNDWADDAAIDAAPSVQASS